MKRYNDIEDYLLISGIQHFMFCKHQWGLIHIEDVWQDNALTYEGKLLHERVDDPELCESRGNRFISRSVPVFSHKLKMQGVIDLIEFNKSTNGIYIESKNGFYIPTIIEYKRGKPKEGLEDKVQLCALAIAFEEMKQYSMDYGYIYYFQTNRREKVFFTEDLRNTVLSLVGEMLDYATKGQTPKPIKMKSCANCSLTDLCSKNFANKSASRYMNEIMKEI